MFYSDLPSRPVRLRPSEAPVGQRLRLRRSEVRRGQRARLQQSSRSSPDRRSGSALHFSSRK